MLSINSFLKSYAERLLVSYSSTERENLNRSYENLETNLKRYFGNNIITIDKFGSFTRGTILPRKYDEYSDIDIMIAFSQSTFKRNPETYRNNLISFAEKYYSRSEIKKDFPTVVLDLHHIKFDLVPAKIENGIFFDVQTISIPDRENNWQTTDPNGFNKKLTEANNRYGSIVKPIIRLLKFWNASHRYPYLSFDLEQKIADMDFYNDNYQSAFFSAIDNLDYWFVPNKISEAVRVLRNNAANVEHYLKIYDQEKALQWLHKIIPFS